MGRLLVPLLITVALIVAVVVTAAGEETRTELEYLDEIRAQATALARSGAGIRQIMPRLREIGRDEFTTVMDSVANDVDVALSFVGSEPPVDSLIPIWSLYRQAVRSWDSGVSTLSSAVLHAADQPDDATVANVIGDGLADLRAGDELFDVLRSEVEREEVPDPITPLTDVNLYPSESGGLASLASTYVAAARASTNNLGLLPGLKVSQILAAPEWDVSVEDQVVIPFTETVVFSVVVTNVGNIASEPGTLSIELVGGEGPVRATAQVRALDPNGQTTIEFEPMDVAPDIAYQVTGELIVDGPDSDPADNRLSTTFTVNAA
ncbi:MAG TPA: hypothetical protein VEB69_07705 [Acidimicrobiia bacterium]|nr:hypothetical protein [Acidimicrobiia bacterium]